jgi:hypothetical protein
MYMGRSRQIACPSTVFHVVVPTKTVYTIVSVFVKSRGILLSIPRIRLLMLVLLGSIFALPDRVRA